MQFKRITRQSAAEDVRQQLIELIRSSRLKVGEKLRPEKDLADSLGVSRPVVREALESLRALGFVSSRNGSGTFVTSRTGFVLQLLGGYTTSELQEVRSALEISGAGLAALRRSADDVKKLRSLLDELDTTTDPNLWVSLDAAYHTTLAAATHNQVQSRLTENLRELLVEQSLRLVTTEPARRMKSNVEHRAIFTAVEKRSGDGARRAMRAHLRNVALGVVEISRRNAIHQQMPTTKSAR